MFKRQTIQNAQITKIASLQRVKWWHGFVLLALLLAIGSIGLLVEPSSAAASNSTNLRSIAHHKFSAVCGQARPQYARCLAELSLASNGHPLTGSPATSGSYGPTQFHTAYNLPCTPGGSVASVCTTPSTYGPTTIAIVDAGNFSSGSSGLESSLQTYDQYYGLPACTLSNSCLNIVNQSGATTPLPADDGWSDEIALDVETAHMVCQTCKIVLVESTSAALSDLAAANVTAATFDPASISNSWGSTTDDPSLDSDFKHAGIAEVAAAGDSGSVSNGAAWPSDIPDVIGVAGTTLQLHTDNTWATETVWSSTGGGCSTYYPTPTWQTAASGWSANGCGSYRSFGDVSIDGDPNTGAAIDIGSTWYEYGGTSLSSPLIAGIYALAGPVPSTTLAASIPYTEDTGSNFHDITSGNDCTSTNTTHCTAVGGFDTPSGLGSPNGVNGFTVLPSQPTNVTATTIDQTHVNLTWTASSATSGIASYSVYRNGTMIATTPSTSYNDSGLTPNASYQYDVVAYASSGNYSLASGTITAVASYPADVNQDGHINLLDLSLLASSYGKPATSGGRADVNRDGTVNLLDLSILAAQYGSE